MIRIMMKTMIDWDVTVIGQRWESLVTAFPMSFSMIPRRVMKREQCLSKLYELSMYIFSHVMF